MNASEGGFEGVCIPVVNLAFRAWGWRRGVFRLCVGVAHMLREFARLVFVDAFPVTDKRGRVASGVSAVGIGTEKVLCVGMSNGPSVKAYE